MSLQLYYDNKKGLVKGKDHAVGCSIVEHDVKGFERPIHEQILEIPERNIKVIVRTNLHYGSKSYMNARITMMDKTVLNFFDCSLLHSIVIVYATPGDWNGLFDGIIHIYNSIFNSGNAIDAYFDALDESIKTKFSDELNNAVARLSEIASELPESIYSDSAIVDSRMKKSCSLFIKRMMGLNVDSIGSKIWVKELRNIFNYLSERDEIFDVIVGV